MNSFVLNVTAFASAAAHIKGKAAGGIAAGLSVLRLREKLADIGKHPGIRCRVGARRAPDGGLVNINHLIEVLQPFQPFAFARFYLHAV